MQAKRIVVNEANAPAGSGVSAVLSVPLEPREAVNFHNIWASCSIEPQDSNANCQGTWVLFYLRDPTSGLKNWTDSLINLETFNAFIIACGVFSASNESPYTQSNVHPLTSRTLEAGGRLVMSATITGITAGLASTRVMLCAHSTRK